MSTQKTLRLSAEQAEYLSTLASEDCAFADLLRSYPSVRITGGTIVSNHAESEVLRDYFTDRLAQMGFDEEYRPNKEGRTLEQLTDALFALFVEWGS